LEQIKQRKLDVLLEVEEKVMSKNALDRSVLDIISDSECGTPDDKLRLFLVYFICSPNMTEVGNKPILQWYLLVIFIDFV
jgi:hypothetical protein